MLWSVVHISAEPVCMAYFTVPPSNPVPLGTATLPGPLPISPPLSFNLAAAKTASSELGMAYCQKQPRLKCDHICKKQTSGTNGNTEMNSLYFLQNLQSSHE